jgi:hypothetical protein
LKKDTKLPKEDSFENVFINSCKSISAWGDGTDLSQTQVYDENWEKEAWKKVDELWERVTAMYAVTEDHSKRYKAIWSEMIERQKCEGKRELRNLLSSVNYGDIKASSKCRKGKAHIL